MSKKIPIPAVVFLFFLSSAFSETIVLKSGTTIESAIIEKTKDFIKISVSGIPITYYLNDIESIDGEVIGESSTSTHSFVASTTEKTPVQIFKDTAPAVVSILIPVTDRATPINVGSGFIVDGDGIVLTCLRLAINAQDIKIKTNDGKIFPVMGIMAVDVTRDLCLLKIDTNHLSFVTLGDSETLIPGVKVFAIDASSKVSTPIVNGVFSTKRKLFSRSLLQATTPVSPENIGGPLIDIYGNTIGIIAFNSKSGHDVSFATGLDKGVKEFIDFSIKKAKEQDLSVLLDNFKRGYGYHDVALGYDGAWKKEHTDTASCFRKGNCGDENCKSAIHSYERIFAIGTLAPDDIQHLGSLYCWCLNDYNKGILYMKKAVEFDPAIESIVNCYVEATETKIDMLLLNYEYDEAQKWKEGYQQDLEELFLFIPDTIAKIRANSKVLNMDWGKLPEKPSGK
jgi:hypothetical protein